MTARTTSAPSGGISRSINDGILVGWRNLKRIPRIPELAIFAIIQSIMFVLLFAFVFGGAINVPGGVDYTSFLMPGIFAQTIVFAAGTTAIGMTDDINKGIVDRFRSLPMARSAVLTGRTFSDVIYNAGILVVLMVTGYIVGWRFDDIPSLVAGFALLLFFAYGMVWLGVWLGLNVPTVEVGQQVIFTVLFPITFVSNVFVPFRDPARLAPADRRVEPDEHLDGRPPRDVGQRAATTDQQPRLDRARARDDRLGDRVHRGLRSARGTPLPLDEPLTLMAAPPWLLALGLVLGLLVLLPARRLQLAGLAPRTIGLLALTLWALGMLVAVSPGGARVLIPILLVAYLAPFVAAPDRVGRILRRGGGPGGRGGGAPPMKNVTPPDADGAQDARPDGDHRP